MALVVFDFDGTLAETRQAVSTTVNHVLRAHQLPRVHPPFIHNLMGLPLTTLLDKLLPPPRKPYDTPALARDYKAAFPTHGEPLVRAYDEVEAVLDTLQAAGHRLAIATSRARPSVTRLLDQLGLTQRFVDLAAGDDPVPGKPAPDLLLSVLQRQATPPDQAVLVGDTTYDLHMAQAAGVRAIAVAQGCHDADRLATASPDLLLHDLHDLPAAVTRWFP